MKTYPLRLVPVFVLSACVLALTTGLVAQYGFGLKPCILCLTQRVPFALNGALAALCLLRPANRHTVLLMGLAALLFFINGGIAVYHVGVEQHWWVSACSSDGPIQVMDLAAEMSKPVEVRCDEPAWNLYGITMAAMNIPFSGGLGLATLALLRLTKRGR